MRAVRIASSMLALMMVMPAAAFAQAGITPLISGPRTLEGGRSEFGGYITIEDEIDVFGLFRRGVGQGFDFGLRAGYTDARGGGLHIGGELRHGLSGFSADGTEVPVALVGGLQLSFMDRANLISVPFGASIGVELGADVRPITLYGLPFLQVDRVDPELGKSNTELEFGIELGGDIFIASGFWAIVNLTVSSHDGDNVSLVLGIARR